MSLSTSVYARETICPSKPWIYDRVTSPQKFEAMAMVFQPFLGVACSMGAFVTNFVCKRKAFTPWKAKVFKGHRF